MSRSGIVIAGLLVAALVACAVLGAPIWLDAPVAIAALAAVWRWIAAPLVAGAGEDIADDAREW